MPLRSEFARGLSLASVLSDGRWLGQSEPRVTSCCSAAEQCQPGDVFVVLDDPHLCSQELIELAAERGASALLTERLIPSPLPQFVVEDIRVAFAQLCHALAGAPTTDIRTIGVTGTYGKSTVATLLSAIFRAASEPTACLLNDNAAIGPLQVAHQLAQARQDGHTHVVLEASSHQLAQRHFAGVQLDAAVITNVRSEHLQLHGSLRNYHHAKRQLLAQLKPGGVAILNADDRTCAAWLSKFDGPAMTIAMHQEAEITASLLERHVSEQTFLLNAGNESMVVRTHMIGDGHIYNCLSAAAAAFALGVDAESIVRGLESVTSLGGRLQRIEQGQPFGLFVDRSTSPQALSHALKTLRSVAKRDLVCVAGINPRLSEEERRQLGQVVEQYADRCVLTGTQLDRKLSLRNAHDVLDGFDRPAQAHLMPDRAKAICWSLAQANPGDVILIAGGGPTTAADDSQLCDEDVARYWLQQSDAGRECPWRPV